MKEYIVKKLEGDVETMLNDYAKLGWEFVCFTPSQTGWRLIFVRNKQ